MTVPQNTSSRRVPVAAQTEAEGSDFMELLALIWRGKWTVLALSFLTMMLGAYYAFAIATPIYRAETRLVLDTDETQVFDIPNPFAGWRGQDEEINTELEIIRSREILERLVAELDLINDPEFNSRLKPSGLLSSEATKNIATTYLGVEFNEKEVSDRDVELSVVRAVRRAISVSAQTETYLYSIFVSTSDPDKSALIANRLAEIYLDTQIKVKAEAASFAVNWLSEEVGELENTVREQDDAIKRLSLQTELVSPEALEAMNIQAKDIRDRLKDASLQVETLEAEQVAITALAQANDLAALQEQLSDPVLGRLLSRAQAGNTEALASFNQRLALLTQQNAAQVTRSVAQRDALQVALARIQEEIQEQNEDLAQINQLVRTADATKILYETLLTRLKESSVQLGLLKTDSRVLSEAVPGRQVAPRTRVITVLAALVGATLGLVILLLRDSKKRGFRTADELENVTGYSVLGQIPLVPVRRRGKILKFFQENPTSRASEAVRNLRTSILMSRSSSPPQVIMITSSIPGEGKTTQSLSLAHNLGSLSTKVLLIEADIRRRTFTEYFNTTPPGDLVTVANGEQELSEAVVSESLRGVDVLMGGKSEMNAADLFSSKAFQDVLTKAREMYDYVIVDTPPVLAVSDARVIAQFVDAIIYTVQWDRTNREQVQAGLRELETAGIDVLGLVLAKVNPKESTRYGYGDYGYYDR